MPLKKRARIRRALPALPAAIAGNGRPSLDPWELVWGQPHIDCDTLAAAIEDDLIGSPDADYRSRLLIHDAARAIRSYWGSTRFDKWIGKSPVGRKIQSILHEHFPEEGFPNIRRKLVASVKSEVVERIFEYKIKRRLFDDGKIFLATPFLSEQIKENWRFIFREPLSAEAPEPQVEKKAPETTKKRKRKRKT